MKNNKVIEYQRGKIKELQKIIDSLKKELDESKETINSLENLVDSLKDSFAIMKAEHDVILRQYQDGLIKMRTMVSENNHAIHEAKLAEKDYENEMNVLLKRLRKQK